MSYMEKLLSVWRILSVCPNQPNLPRQLKTHIAFLMFPILEFDTNLCFCFRMLQDADPSILDEGLEFLVLSKYG